MTRLRTGSATDVGRRRNINQDMVLVSDGIYAIADGMGGHQGGEVASLAAVEALKKAFGERPTMEGLVEAVRAANEAVAVKARASTELRNMGTTLTVVAQVEDDDDLLVIANVGDSRAYLLRNGELSQLTEDHSLPQELLRQGQLSEAEAAVDPRRNILTRVLGASFGEGPDVQNLIPYTGDRILLCSDGLYNEVDDDEVARVLRTVGDPTEAARKLVDQANTNGGADNISVVIVDVVDDDGRAITASEVLADDPASPPASDRDRNRSSGSRLMTSEQRNAELRQLGRDDSAPRAATRTDDWESDASPSELSEPTRRITGRVVAFVLVLLLVLGGAAGAIGFYARGSYFVGLDEGRVAIFKGRPGGLLWFAPTVEEITPLTEASVPPSRADAVAEGHPVATLDEGRAYVQSLQTTPGATPPAAPTPPAPAAPPADPATTAPPPPP